MTVAVADLHTPVVADDVMRDVYGQAKKAATTDANVLIWGGPGTGKLTLAAEIHRLSPRKSGPFECMNAVTLAETMCEPFLFGSCTGISMPNGRVGPGILESAAGGTVVLAMPEELPLWAQARLARALCDRRVTRVGETTSRAIDVRVIATTTTFSDLKSQRDEGRWHDDFYACLGEVTLRMPMLRERPQEVRILAREFLREYCLVTKRTTEPTISAAAMEKLVGRKWLGGIRELRSAMTSAVLQCEGDELLIQHFEDHDP